MELRPLVVGVDGSEASLRAVDWAADAAARRGVPLRLVYASLWEYYEGTALATDLGSSAEQVRAEDIVAGAALRVRNRHPEVMVSAEVVPEEAEYVLLKEGRNATAVVVGTRGRSGLDEALLGSVSLTVAGHAYCPVIVVRSSPDNEAKAPSRRRVVVAVGEDTKGSAAVRFAYEEARLRQVPLEAVRAWRRPAHKAGSHPPPDFVRGYHQLAGELAWEHEQRAVEELEAALRDVPPDVRLQRRTAEGPARRVLADASHNADLLVVGARRRHGHHGLQLGRVAHALLHDAACPVAVVPEGA